MNRIHRKTQPTSPRARAAAQRRVSREQSEVRVCSATHRGVGVTSVYKVGSYTRVRYRQIADWHIHAGELKRKPEITEYYVPPPTKAELWQSLPARSPFDGGTFSYLVLTAVEPDVEIGERARELLPRRAASDDAMLLGQRLQRVALGSQEIAQRGEHGLAWEGPAQQQRKPLTAARSVGTQAVPVEDGEQRLLALARVGAHVRAELCRRERQVPLLDVDRAVQRANGRSSDSSRWLEPFITPARDA
eukprot:489225-Prymnesium_polylepis.1